MAKEMRERPRERFWRQVDTVTNICHCILAFVITVGDSRSNEVGSGASDREECMPDQAKSADNGMMSGL